MAENDDETGRALRTEWFHHLRDLGDIFLQRHKWLDPQNKNPHWSYIEFVCSYPDYDQLEFARNRGWLAAEEKKILSDFRIVLAGYTAPNGDDWDNAAVLNDTAWLAVVAEAQNAIGKMLALQTDESSRQR